MSGNLYAEKYEDGSFDICLDDGGDSSSHLVIASRQAYPERRDELHRYADMFAASNDLHVALSLYVAICGNTAASVSRESAQIAYETAMKAMQKATGGAQ